MIDQPLFLVAVLAINVALSEWLAKHTALRHLGSALLVIVITAIAANVGLIPTVDGSVAVYDAVFAYLAPMAIFLLLLRVDLRGLLRAGTLMIALFFLGAAGTVAGVLVGMAAIDGSATFGQWHHALAGMFVGTYTGGSINYNAVALHYGVQQEGALFAGAAAVDSAATTVWMAATIVLPRWLARFWPSSKPSEAPGDATGDLNEEIETVGPFDLALLIGMAAGAVWFSRFAGEALAARTGYAFPWVLLLTGLALLLAQWRPVQRLRGARVTGWIAVMFFLAVIGALCDLGALRAIGSLGPRLVMFVTVVIAVHAVIVFGGARLLGADAEMAAIASQANIGGSTSALALARSLGRADLRVAAVLIGSLGNAAGNFLGIGVADLLR